MITSVTLHSIVRLSVKNVFISGLVITRQRQILNNMELSFGGGVSIRDSLTSGSTMKAPVMMVRTMLIPNSQRRKMK